MPSADLRYMTFRDLKLCGIHLFLINSNQVRDEVYSTE